MSDLIHDYPDGWQTLDGLPLWVTREQLYRLRDELLKSGFAVVRFAGFNDGNELGVYVEVGGKKHAMRCKGPMDWSIAASLKQWREKHT